MGKVNCDAVILFALLVPITAAFLTFAEKPFDVRQHLCTVTSYQAAVSCNDENFLPEAIPDTCSPIHLNLVARHGTRAPTKKRIKELERLATRLHSLVADVKHDGRKDEPKADKVPEWFWQWESPWKGKKKGGELIVKGENELYELGIRVRERFPEIFDEEYHPDTYAMRSSQVPRASASAVAFGLGLFSGTGDLGPGKHRAFSVISESRASDIWLRFHDTCKTYKAYRKSQEPSVHKLKEPVLEEITSTMTKRYSLNFTKEDVASLWFLCKQEASLLNITSQACGLFSSDEVSLLEWTDDLEVFTLKGYGKSLNYRMGVPLLEDVYQSMEQSILAKEGNNPRGTYEKARLRFAHAETVVPFTCLLGLFLEGSDFKKIESEQQMQLPPKPPHKRNWRGSAIAPFAGNTMLVLYSCAGNNSDGAAPSTFEGYKNKYFVQVLHNESPVPIPGCHGKEFCPFQTFKERIVDPHLKHDYESLCKPRPNVGDGDLSSPKHCSIGCRLGKFFRWLFFLEEQKSYSSMDEDEL